MASGADSSLRRSPVWRYLLVRLTVVAVVLVYLGLGWYAAPAADDFALASRGRDLGLFGGQYFYYQHWCGRYTAIYLQVGFPLVLDMVRDYWLIPWTLLILTVASYWCAASALAARRWADGEMLWVAFGATAVWLTRMPSVLDGFYWFAAAVTYQLGHLLAGFLFAALWVPLPATAARRAGRGVVVVVLAVLAAGCNELLTALLLAGLTIGTVVGWRQRWPATWLWLAALVAVGAGAAVMLLAPGNATHSAEFPHARQFGPALLASLAGTRECLVRWLPDPLWVPLAVLLWPLAARLRREYPLLTRLRWFHVVGLGGLLVLVLWGCLFVPWWAATDITPRARTVNAAFWVFTLGLAALLVATAAVGSQVISPSWCLRPGVRRTAQVLVVLALLFAGHFPKARADFVIAPLYQEQWALRLKRIGEAKARGEKDLRLTPVNYPHNPKDTIAYPDITDDPNDAVNLGFADYFRVGSVTLVAEEPGADEAAGSGGP